METVHGKFARKQLDSGITLQSAAVCYRVRDFSVEFLLVNTSSGKWTFPKGRIEPTLSASESAAREAWEEAGARGRIEHQHFALYIDTKRTLGHDNHSREIMVASFLLEVHATVKPQESDRNPTWFSPEQARKRLRDARRSKYASQISSVIDAAVDRINEKKFRGIPQILSRSKRGRLLPLQ